MKPSHLILTLLIASCLLLVGGVQANAFSAWTVEGTGYISTNDTYVLRMWNNTVTPHTWISTGNATTIEYLVVAGGASGGRESYATGEGGGGGAGGVLFGTGYSVSGTVNVIVGDGGAPSGQTVGYPGNNGGNSSFANTTAGNGINALGGGGGGGGSSAARGRDGGSGGGSANAAERKGFGINVTYPIQQGFDGGASGGTTNGGGGGGAGEAGNINADGWGGDGIPSVINGTEVWYGGGGAGASGAGTLCEGGRGGGGNGGKFQGDIRPTSGVNQSGGGGGGTINSDGAMSAGGSGIIIIKYLTPGVAPVASFTSRNITSATNSTGQGWAGVAPFQMVFNDTSTGSPPTSWVYNATNVTGNNVPFGMNATAVTLANISYTFATAGNYTIKLNATNAYGTNISTQVTWVNVTSGVTLPVPIWSSDKYTVVFPGRVTITDSSLNTPTMWNWSAGDGNWHNATIGTAFTYQYTKRGVWQASMTTSNAAGTNTSATQQFRVIGYQGFTPVMPDVCSYSTSRALNYIEKLMTDCKVCGICY